MLRFWKPQNWEISLYLNNLKFLELYVMKFDSQKL